MFCGLGLELMWECEMDGWMEGQMHVLRNDWWSDEPSLVRNWMNSVTYRSMSSFASRVINALGGTAFFMILVTSINGLVGCQSDGWIHGTDDG